MDDQDQSSATWSEEFNYTGSIMEIFGQLKSEMEIMVGAMENLNFTRRSRKRKS